MRENRKKLNKEVSQYTEYHNKILMQDAWLCDMYCDFFFTHQICMRLIFAVLTQLTS